MNKLHSLLGAACLIAPLFAMAQPRNDVPGCYSHAKLNPSLAAEAHNRELFIVIDGTFSPDEKIKQMVQAKVQRFITPGDRINVISFAALVSDHYTDLKFSGLLETGIKDRDDVPKKALMIFDSCLKKQKTFVHQRIEAAITDSYRKEQVLPKTEIINNLAQVVGPAVLASTANRKVVLLVSDLFENSDVTSFYANNQIRIISPEAEMAKVTTAGLLSDFGGAEIYIAGAGWMEPDYRGFRGTKIMTPLKTFWQSYFKSANANVKGFGQPMLIEEL